MRFYSAEECKEHGNLGGNARLGSGKVAPWLYKIPHVVRLAPHQQEDRANGQRPLIAGLS